MDSKIAVIDLKAFYSFVECVERGLNPLTTPLAVCDASRGDGTIVLSVSPYLKEMGVPSRCRKRELPDIPGMIFAAPRMELYIKKSAEVVSIVLDFVGEDDIHIYSIDELFINLSPYLKMYKMTPYELVNTIKEKIFEKTRLVSTAGIGDNMLLAKLALDLDGKKNPPYISVWTKEDVPTKLWPVTPLSKMWGISTNFERRLNKYGIFTVGQLANADKNFLKKELGVIGEQLWEHANGIDNTNIREKYVPESTSLSLGQVLFRDYNKDEAKLIVKEMCDDLTSRLREKGFKTGCVSVSIGYSMGVYGGFSRQAKLESPTNDTHVILKELNRLYDKYIEDLPIRRVYLSYGMLTDSEYTQLSLFEDNEDSLERENLDRVMDEVKKRFGKNAVLRGSSLTEASTAKERHSQIGGHKR